MSHVMVSCQLSAVSCQLSAVSCQLSAVTCHLSPVTCHLSPVTCHLSPVTCHLSPVIWHLSPVTPSQTDSSSHLSAASSSSAWAAAALGSAPACSWNVTQDFTLHTSHYTLKKSQTSDISQVSGIILLIQWLTLQRSLPDRLWPRPWGRSSWRRPLPPPPQAAPPWCTVWWWMEKTSCTQGSFFEKEAIGQILFFLSYN